MIGVESFPDLLGAGRTVGLVLVQSIVLYVGYGALVQVARPYVSKGLER